MSTLIRNIILANSNETLGKAFQYIISSQPMPDDLIDGNCHSVRHAIILFYKKYGGDRTNFKLGFDDLDLKGHTITKKELENNLEKYLDLSENGEIFIITDIGLCLLSNEVYNSLVGYT